MTQQKSKFLAVQSVNFVAIAGFVLAMAPAGTANAAILAQYGFGDAVAHDTAPSPTAELGATILAPGVVAGDITPGSIFTDTTTIHGFEQVVPHVINQATGGGSGSSTVNGINYNFTTSGNNHWFAVTSNEDDPTAEDGGSATTMVIADQDLLDVGGGSDRGGVFLNVGGRSNSYGQTAGQAFTQGHSFSWTITASGGDLLIEDISMLVARTSARSIWSNLELYVNGVLDTTLLSVFPNVEDAGDLTLRSAIFDIADITLLDGNTATFTLAGFADTPNSFGRDSFFDDITVNGTTTAAGGPSTFAITAIDYDPDADTVTLTWRSRPNTTYKAFSSLDLSDWSNELADSLDAAVDEIAGDGAHITETFPLTDGLEEASDLFFRIQEE